MSSQELVLKLASLKSIIEKNDPEFKSISHRDQEEFGLSQISTQDTLSDPTGNHSQWEFNSYKVNSQDTQLERRTSARIREREVKSAKRISLPKSKTVKRKRVTSTPKSKKVNRQNEAILEASHQEPSQIKNPAYNADEIGDMELDLRIKACLSILEIESLTDILNNEFKEYNNQSRLNNYGYIGKDEIINEILRFINRRAMDIYLGL